MRVWLQANGPEPAAPQHTYIERSVKVRDVKKTKSYTKDEPPTKMIRENIFQIPLLSQEMIGQLFGELDSILAKRVARLAEEIPMVRNYFIEIVERIASGSTLGKNYYNKHDHEDGKAKAKKTTILQPSEVRILKQAFWLLRASETPKVFAKLVIDISFLRGIMEESIEIFLTQIQDYNDLHKRLVDAKNRHCPEYLRIEQKIDAVHAQLGISDPDLIFEMIRETELSWEEYVETRAKIIEPYLRMVYSWAKDFSSSETQTLDNFQAGTFGLVRAVKNYTPARFAHFSVVAEQWVKQSILQYLKTEVNFIRLPMANWHYLQKIDKAKNKLEQQLNREPTVEEIAKESELTITKVKKIMEHALLVKVFSLDAPTLNEEEQDMDGSWNRDSIESQNSPEDQIMKQSEIDVVRNVIQLFDSEERTIFGLISGCYEVIPDPSFSEEELLKEKIRQKAAQFNLEISFK